MRSEGIDRYLFILVVATLLANQGCARGGRESDTGTTSALAAPSSPIPTSAPRSAESSRPAGAPWRTTFHADELIPIHFKGNVRAFERPRPPTGIREEAPDYTIPVSCGEHHCLDGLRDVRSGRTLISTEPDSGEREMLRSGTGIERAVRVSQVRDDTISVYLARTWFTPGAAHMNTYLGCETYDRRTGRKLRLEDLMPPAAAKRLLQRVNALVKDADLGK